MLKIYNTLSNKKEIFNPVNKKIINLYVCGITVYKSCHLGHGRIYIFFDIIIRYFNFIGYKVKYVRNITDIDDKIIKTCFENKLDIKKYTNDKIINMKRDLSSLNLIKPEIEPKVTSYIFFIIRMIKKLLKYKIAYVSKVGDILFNVKKYLKYGSLSKININNRKINIDFVLWKKSKKNEFGWKSKWGIGRPGWHIECSTICCREFKYLDIHGGGKDLIFPHHENEIAQSKSVNDNFFVNNWMHVGLLTVNNIKMSKSLGNVITINKLLKKFTCEEIRFYLISKHYRKDINYNINNLIESTVSLKKLYFSLTNLYFFKNIKKNKKIDNINNLENKFFKALNNDFNTPKAISILFKISKKIFLSKKNNKRKGIYLYKLKKLGNILGILYKDPLYYLKKNKNKSKIKVLIKLRNISRIHRNWKRSDKIRKKLIKLKLFILDKKNKTFWYNK